MIHFLSNIGAFVRHLLESLGLAFRLFVQLVRLFKPNMRRFRLVSEQMHFLGNYSLAIISVSGLFVGFDRF